MAKIFNIPFATTGDREPIPQEAQEDNHVSYAEGYTEEYGLDPATSAEALDIERTKFNGLVHDITEAIFELQRHGVALWSADAAPYPAKARVYYSGAVWSSQSDNNSQVPGEGSAWVRDEVVFSTESQALLGEDASTAMSPLRTHQAFNQYGLGDSQINGPTIVDVDDHTIPAGFYAAVNGQTAGTHPPGASGYSVLVLPYRLVAPGNLWTQQIAVLNADRGGHTFVRNYSGATSTWGSWKRLMEGGAVTPQMFGARANGEFDDTAAIQDAIDSLPIGGGCVYLPAGKYRITSHISLPMYKRVKLTGCGPAAILYADTALERMILVEPDPNYTVGAGGDADYVQDREISNISIHLDAAVDTIVRGIEVSNTHQITVRGVWFGHFIGGTSPNSATGPRYTEYAKLIGIYGARTNNSLYADNKAIQIVQLFDLNEDVDDVIIRGNDASYCNNGLGVVADCQGKVNIIGNVCEESFYGPGLLLKDSNYLSIVGNSFSENYANSGAVLHNVKYSTITANVALDNQSGRGGQPPVGPGAGILLTGESSFNTITANTLGNGDVSATQQHGLYIEPTGKGNLIVGNTARNTVKAGIVAEGEGNKFIGNTPSGTFFTARKQSDQTLPSDGAFHKVVFDIASPNLNDEYNTTDASFVAPNYGIYMFEAQVNLEGVMAQDRLTLSLYVDGQRRMDIGDSVGPGGSFSAGGSGTLVLEAGEEVSIWMRVVSSGGGTRTATSSGVATRFSGILLR